MSLSTLFRKLGIEKFTLEGMWGEPARYSRLRPITELDAEVLQLTRLPKTTEGLALNVISHGENLCWLLDAPMLDGKRIASIARWSKDGVIIPPSYAYCGLDYVFWRGRHDGEQYHILLSIGPHSEQHAKYLSVEYVIRTLHMSL